MLYLFFLFNRMSKENMEDKGYINIRFIIFLKTTLGKMVATGLLPKDFIDLHFWQQWPKKIYNIKYYDSSKNDFVKQSKRFQCDDMEKDDVDVPDLDHRDNDVDNGGDDGGDEDGDGNGEEIQNENYDSSLFSVK